MDHTIKKGDALYHLTQAGIAEACVPLVRAIDDSGCCVSGQALLAYDKAKQGVAHAGDVDTLKSFAGICQRVMDGKR